MRSRNLYRVRIGVFDSGVGGVTVLKELRKRFPSHQYLYFGDTANVPYGSKSPTQIRALCRGAALKMELLRIDALVIACNTAASIALNEFKQVLSAIPILDVVEAGVESITEALPDGHAPALILGTRATVRSKIYSDWLGIKSPEVRVFEQECPLLVPLIEEGWIEHPILSLTVEEYVREYRNLHPGVALLACTHYPWIRKAFENRLPGWNILDSAGALARIAGNRLLLGLDPEPGPHPAVTWFFSDPDALSRHILEETGPTLSKL
jgi:glutamate racemase